MSRSHRRRIDRRIERAGNLGTRRPAATIMARLANSCPRKSAKWIGPHRASPVNHSRQVATNVAGAGLSLVAIDALATDVDRCHDRLHCSGWSVGDCRFILANRGLVWLVTCTHGQHVLQTRAPTQREAWREACKQEKALGLLQEGV